MKIASYVLLGLLSCVEVYAGDAAFDRAVEAYRTYKKAQRAWFEAIDAHEETRLAWDAYWAADRSDDEAHKKALAVWEEARDANKEVKGAHAIFKITGYGYNKAQHAIEEVKLALAAWEEARRAMKDAQDTLDNAKYGRALSEDEADAVLAPLWEAYDAADEASDTYFTVLEVFDEAIKKAYERGDKNH